VVPEVTGRSAALDALRRVERGESFLRDELHAVFARANLPPRDRALAMQLAAGVVRHRRTLRLIISHLRGGRGREGAIQPHLRQILELGAFQLLFLDRVPSYAAVNEAAEQARRASAGRAGEKASGFVNGILRALERLIAGRDHDGRPARDALPHPDGGVVRLKAAVLPDPKESFAAFLGTAYSFPDWLIARWLGAFGGRTEEICRWSNRRPHTYARLNPMHGYTSRDVASRDREACPEPGRRVAGTLASVKFPPGPRPGSFDVSGLAPEELDALIEEGVLTVQDPSAMAPVEALAPAPGESVLDLCASPGTKTTQIAEAMGDRPSRASGSNDGRVVACDRREEKLQTIRRTVAARGLAGVTVCLSDSVAAAAPAAGFDAALVDVPCSNTGVLARRVEVRWRLRPEDLEELPRLQLELIARAAALVRAGGRLVYSTCSLQEEENGAVVAAFLESNPAWRRVRSDLTLPGPDHDGVFWSLLARQP